MPKKNHPMKTRADWIRSASDEQLAEFLTKETFFCQEKAECLDKFQTGSDVTEEACRRCLERYLAEPVESWNDMVE